MVRSAAKNFQSVGVVTDHNDYSAIVTELHDARRIEPGNPAVAGAQGLRPHRALRRRNCHRTGTPHRHRRRHLHRRAGETAGANQHLPGAPAVDAIRRKSPSSGGPLYSCGDVASGFAGATQLQGKELSYNNLVDLDAAWELVAEFHRPAVAIIKHNNPRRAERRRAGPRWRKATGRRWNAIPSPPSVACWRSIARWTVKRPPRSRNYSRKRSSRRITRRKRSKILGARKNLRLLQVVMAPPDVVIKSISGGLLAQTPDERAARIARNYRSPPQRAPSVEECAALLFGWKVCKHVKSNAIVFARDGQTVGVGAGQMSRVDSVKIARHEGGESSAGGKRGGLGRIFPVPGWRRGSRESRSHCGDSARRIDGRRRSDRHGRQIRHGYGFFGCAAFPPLTAEPKAGCLLYVISISCGSPVSGTSWAW